ncbi:hypothetical protein MTO96_048147 [Rhipicephalus appendiculatus]
MSISGLQPPPPSLPSPGYPAVPLDHWKQAFRCTWWLPELYRPSSRMRSAHLPWHGGAADFPYAEASGPATWLCYRYYCQPYEYR